MRRLTHSGHTEFSAKTSPKANLSGWLSDEDHAIADKYGVWGMKKFMGKEFMGLIRTTFIIGKDGKLLKVMDNLKPKRTMKMCWRSWMSCFQLESF